MEKKKRIILVVSFIIVAVVYYLLTNNMFLNANPKTIDNQQNDEQFEIQTQTTIIYVQVSGEVLYPNLYAVNDKMLLYDLLKLAGLKDTSDVSELNLAELVKPNHNYAIKKNSSGEPISQNTNPNLNNSSPNATTLVNINTASKSELMMLTGVGEVLANRIIGYRAITKFNTIEDIMKVNGIKEKNFEKIKDYITIQ